MALACVGDFLTPLGLTKRRRMGGTQKGKDMIGGTSLPCVDWRASREKARNMACLSRPAARYSISARQNSPWRDWLPSFPPGGLSQIRRCIGQRPHSSPDVDRKSQAHTVLLASASLAGSKSI